MMKLKVQPFNPSYGNPADPSVKLYLSGWRRGAVMLALFTGLFLALLDTSIVAVALATITNELGGFAKSTWVFTGYLVTNTAFGIISASLSEVVGMGRMWMASLLLFAACSVGCAVSHNMTTLIIFRAFQGIGGSGLFTLAMTTGLSTIQPKDINAMATWIGVTQAIAVVAGPILGGVITHSHDVRHTNWRYIFWLNLPFCFMAFVAFMAGWPHRPLSTLWHLMKSVSDCRWWNVKSLTSSFDFLGSALLVIATVMLVYVLQEAGVHKIRWNSPAAFISIVVSMLSFISFVIWQVYLYRRNLAHNAQVCSTLENFSETNVVPREEYVHSSASDKPLRDTPSPTDHVPYSTHMPRKSVESNYLRPLLPIHLFTVRPIAAALLTIFLSGFDLYLALINLPDRSQIVGGDNPVEAGIRVLPLMGAATIGIFAAGGPSLKRNLTSYTTMIGAAVQLVGYGSLTTLGSAPRTPEAIYGCEVLIGLGFGLAIGGTNILVVLQCLRDNLPYVAIMMGTMAQAEYFGGCIGQTVASIVFTEKIKHSAELHQALTPQELRALYRSPLVISQFNTTQQAEVAQVYARAFTSQMWLAMYVAALCLGASVFTWRRDPPSPDPEVGMRPSSTKQQQREQQLRGERERLRLTGEEDRAVELQVVDMGVASGTKR